MQMAENFDVSTLAWVKGEIDETIKQARIALDSFVDDPDDQSQLQFCVTYLHQVRGTLQMVELRGAAQFANEMEQLASALLKGDVKPEEATLEVLMRALLQLPDYLETLQGGQKDSPLLLLPLMNGMREARGEKPFAASVFFQPDLNVAAPGAAAAPADIKLHDFGRKLRRYYQAGLLNLIRGKEPENSLKAIATVVDKLRCMIRRDQVQQCFWVASAFVEALRDGGVALDATAKQLLGKVDQLIKTLIDGGEEALPEKLLTNFVRALLYQVGSATSGGPAVTSVRNAFRLDDFLPAGGSDAAASLGGFNAELKRTVSADILEELSKVKDLLDVFVRSDSRILTSLEPMVETLARLGDTLSLLRQESLREAVQGQVKVLQRLLSGEVEGDDAVWMGVAGAVLAVESALSDWGSSSPVERADDMDEQLSEAETSPEAEAEHRRVIRQVMKEAKDELIKLREAVNQYLERPSDKSVLEKLPRSLHEVIGSLSLLSYKRVAQVLRACQMYIQAKLIDARSIPPSEDLDALADAVMSVEYYFEAFVESRVHPASVLEVAEDAVARLGYAVDSLPADAPAPGISFPAADSYSVMTDAGSANEDPHADGPAGAADTAGEDEAERIELAAAQEAGAADIVEGGAGEETVTPGHAVPVTVEAGAPATPASRHAAPSVPDIDEEILEIFVEEAEEELRNIGELLPKWKSNPADSETLATLRRSFHTLKGSGRLVGASRLGEFAWAYENMLNRVIEGTVAPGPTMFDLLDLALEGLPCLIAEFKDGTPCTADIEIFQGAAGELAQSGAMALPPAAVEEVSPAAVEEVSPAALADVPAPKPEPGIRRPVLDAVLLEIYSNEANGHLSDLTAFITSCRDTKRCRVTEPLIRALHTLQGSSRMAGVTHAAEVSGVLEKYAKLLQSNGLSVSAEGLVVLQESRDFIQGVLGYLQDGTASAEPDDTEILAKARSLYAAVQHLEDERNVNPEHGLAGLVEETPDGIDSIDDTEIQLHGMPVAEAAEFLAEPFEPARNDYDPRESAAELDAWLATELGELSPDADADDETADEFSGSASLIDGAGLLALDGALADEPLPRDGGIAAEDGPANAAGIQEAAQDYEMPRAPEGQAEPVEGYGEDLDPDLLDIFLEEGAEILDASEETLQSWVDNPGDRSLVAALQRQLHTLKGGARMAGLRALGDLSHRLESIFDAVVEGRLSHSKELDDLLQLSHDRLVVMLDEVRDHRPLSTADDLVRQLDALAGLTDAEEVHLQDAEPAMDAARHENARLEPEFVEHAPVGEPPSAAEEAVTGSATEQPAAGEDVRAEAAADSDADWFGEASPVLGQSLENLHTWKLEPTAGQRFLDFDEGLTVLKEASVTAEAHGISELADSMIGLTTAVKDGYVPVSERLFSLLENGHLRARSIADIRPREVAAAIPVADIVDSIEEFVARSRAEQEAERVRAEAQEQPRAEAVAGDEAPKTQPTGAATGAEADSAADNRRRGPRIQHEMVRVRSDLLDNLVNFAGEVSIYRSRVEQSIGSYRFNIAELHQTVERLREQVRQFDIETEAQIESRYEEAAKQNYEDFDPLEFDRFTNMQQLSRSMMESLSDLVSIEDMMLNMTRATETLLLQQARVNTELQENLVHTRMVPLVENAPRLRRIVRQTCVELGKQATLSFKGAEVEMDRHVVERMMAPLEHMLRNAIAHGLEMPAARAAAGKPEEGSIVIALSREGSEVVIRVNDDGAGIDLDRVRAKAIERGLMKPGADFSDREVMQFILESGFSTAETLTQIAGRGVGMDVVNSEIKQLGGVLELDSAPGKGTSFTVRLPLTLSVSRALLVNAGEEIYAIPLLSIHGIERVAPDELASILAAEQPEYQWLGKRHDVLHLSSVLGLPPMPASADGSRRPLLLAQTGDHRVALAVDGLIGSREIVVKSLGPQLSTLPDVAGATILADGQVTLILDLPSLIRRGLAKRSVAASVAVPVEPVEAQEPLVMVVDDSITVRKVTERLLKRNHMRAITAKDGVDALNLLEEGIPDVMLLDIEMPRMDGYELATHIRNSERLKHLPIIMITSRTGDKHKQRAIDIGVDIYMGKPYTETDLLENIQSLLGEN